MGIPGLPSNLNSHAAESKLKLVAAAALPVIPPATIKADRLQTEKNELPKLSDEELVQISTLKAQDAKVREHEQAHRSASGGLNVSSASYTYQRGPNGVNYAVAGEVKIDASAGRTPEETLARAEMIIDAALAPADPSSVDRSVAAKAQNMAQQAQLEILQQDKKMADHHAAVGLAYEENNIAKKNIDTFA